MKWLPEKIAGHLPTVVDKMTPGGLVPDADAVAQKLMGFLKR